MNLFALTKIPGARIVRFPLTQALQTEVEAVFAAQHQAFLNGIHEVVAFDGRYSPEPGELLKIENFEDVDGMADAVANPVGVDQFDPAQHSLDAVKALFASHTLDGVERILIQCFETRRLIATKGLAIFYSGNTFQKMSDAGLTLDTKLLAVLEGSTLKFQSFHFLRRVFEVADYFNEATNEDMTAFAAHEKLHVSDVPQFLGSAHQLIRKKIALIAQSGVLDQFSAETIATAAQAFNVPVQTQNGKVVLPTNRTELLRLLRFLDEDYYESALSQTRFLSNSKRVAD
jgi:hypothetical protein